MFLPVWVTVNVVVEGVVNKICGLYYIMDLCNWRLYLGLFEYSSQVAWENCSFFALNAFVFNFLLLLDLFICDLCGLDYYWFQVYCFLPNLINFFYSICLWHSSSFNKFSSQSVHGVIQFPFSVQSSCTYQLLLKLRLLLPLQPLLCFVLASASRIATSSLLLFIAFPFSITCSFSPSYFLKESFHLDLSWILWDSNSFGR